jgi:hypothetical protein
MLRLCAAEFRQSALDRAAGHTGRAGNRGDVTPARRTRFARNEQPTGALVQRRRRLLKPGPYDDGVAHPRRQVRRAHRFLAPDSLIPARALNAAGDRPAAQQYYFQALVIAKRQSARLLQLRASISLARFGVIKAGDAHYRSSRSTACSQEVLTHQS